MACALLGHVVEMDLETGARVSKQAVRAVLRVVSEDGREWVHVKRMHEVNAYDLADADGVHGAAAVSEGRAALRFTSPRRQVLVQTEDTVGLVAFLCAVRAGATRQGARLVVGYDPRMARYVSAGAYDRMPRADLGSHLNALVLMNVDATALNDQIGRLPVSYVNLTGSKLDTSDRTSNWDWMTSATICDTLTALVLNNVGLCRVPFEIVFLRRLRTLSLASNKLKHLPHTLGELTELECLFIDDNFLTYLPICLKDKTFKHLNISNNKLEEFVVELHENKDKQFLKTKRSPKNPSSMNLLYMSLYTIIENRVGIKRQELFCLMYHYFDIVYRCPDCNHLMMPDYSSEYYEFGYASTINLMQNTVISWQSFGCNYSHCKSYTNYFQNLL